MFFAKNVNWDLLCKIKAAGKATALIFKAIMPAQRRINPCFKSWAIGLIFIGAIITEYPNQLVGTPG